MWQLHEILHAFRSLSVVRQIARCRLPRQWQPEREREITFAISLWDFVITTLVAGLITNAWENACAHTLHTNKHTRAHKRARSYARGRTRTHIRTLSVYYFRYGGGAVLRGVVEITVFVRANKSAATGTDMPSRMSSVCTRSTCHSAILHQSGVRSREFVLPRIGAALIRSHLEHNFFAPTGSRRICFVKLNPVCQQIINGALIFAGRGVCPPSACYLFTPTD